jgi:hypothetical protein
MRDSTLHYQNWFNSARTLLEDIGLEVVREDFPHEDLAPKTADPLFLVSDGRTVEIHAVNISYTLGVLWLYSRKISKNKNYQARTGVEREVWKNDLFKLVMCVGVTPLSVIGIRSLATLEDLFPTKVRKFECGSIAWDTYQSFRGRSIIA